MKINCLAVKGFLAINDVSAVGMSPISLFCGFNEAGKSSLRDAIFQVFTGSSPRIPKKKDYKHLINRSHKKAYLTLICDGEERSMKIPSTDYKVPESHPALPYLLDPELFARSSPDARVGFLFNLVNVNTDHRAIKQILIDRGCDPEKVEQVSPFLRSGFESAYERAVEATKEARSDWKAITGETYGENKADDWKAMKPYVDPKMREQVKAGVSEIDAEHTKSNQELGGMRAKINGQKQMASEIARLRTKAENEERIRSKLDYDRSQYAEFKSKVEEIRSRAIGSRPGAIACVCPECKSELVFSNNELISRGGDLHGDEDSITKLPQYEESLKTLETSVRNGERDFAEAVAARESLAAIESRMKNEEMVTEEQIANQEAKIKEIESRLEQLRDSLADIDKQIYLSEKADEITATAKKHHTNVQAWERMASLLAPDGIPSEMLKNALAPLNARLIRSAVMTGWKEVTINPDMSITYGDVPYELSSVSAKWRANVMIAEAISYLSGIRFFMVDEFDLLDMRSRSACLKWMIGLCRSEELDSILLFGTLKEKPSNLPAEVKSYWLENGLLIEQAGEAVA